VLQGHPYAKRDDVIAIVYNLLFLMDSKTSWFEHKIECSMDHIIKFKRNSPSHVICGGMRCSMLIPLYEEVYSIGFKEVPNYAKLRFLLAKQLMGIHCAPDNIYSFLQTDFKFIGFVMEPHGEDQKELGDVDENKIEVNSVLQLLPKHNFEVLKQGPPKKKNNLSE